MAIYCFCCSPEVDRGRGVHTNLLGLISSVPRRSTGVGVSADVEPAQGVGVSVRGLVVGGSVRPVFGSGGGGGVAGLG